MMVSQTIAGEYRLLLSVAVFIRCHSGHILLTELPHLGVVGLRAATWARCNSISPCLPTPRNGGRRASGGLGRVVDGV